MPIAPPSAPPPAERSRHQPGASLLLRDLLAAEEWLVSERTASQTVPRGSILYTRVLPLDGVAICVGCGATAIPADFTSEIFDLREELSHGDDPLALDDLLRLDDRLRGLYFELAERVHHPPPLELRNTDGDPFELIDLRYELLASPQEALDALQSLAFGHSREDLRAMAERDDSGRVLSASFPWAKKGNKQHKSWNNTILGHLEISDGALTIQVNSRRRAERIRKEVKRRLGAHARLLEEHVRTAASLFDEAEGSAGSEESRRLREESEQLERDPAVQALTERARREHWQDWLDQELPALRGQTPREAAKHPRGRERLESLLLGFEGGGGVEENPMAPDVPALRRALGLVEEPGGE
jgi:hypothetical protein